MTKFSQTFVLAGCVLVSACGSNPEEEEKQKVDYASFDDAAVEKMVTEGEYQQALDIIKGQVELEVADSKDFLLESEIYLTLLDGVAAEVSVEKAREAGATDEEVNLKLARAYLLQGKAAEAKEKLDDAEFEGDERYQAMLLRGDVAQEERDFEGAQSYFRKAIEENPEDFRGHLGLGLLALNQGQLAEAEAHAADAAALVEDDPIIRYVRGSVARYQGRTEDAKAHLQKAVELHNANLLAYFELISLFIEAGDTEQAQKQLDAVYALTPNSPMAQYYSALMLAIEGKPQEAEYLLLRTGDFTRAFPPAARVYGHVAFALGKYSTAQPYLERFLDRVPSDRVTRLALAECLTRRGQAKKALKYLEPLLPDNSEDLEALLQAAAAHGSMGQVADARKYIEQANTVARSGDERDEELIALIGQRLALTQFISGDNEGAIKQLRSLYADEGADVESLSLMANIQMESGDLTGAEETANRILELEPESAVGLNFLGALRFRERNTDAAIERYTAALNSNPDYQSALKNRALAYLATQQFEKAKADLMKLADAGVEDAQVHAMLGRVYLELGNGRDAANSLKRAEAIIPESAIIATDLAEAMALSGFRSSAITQANKAKKLAVRDKNLVQYLEDLIVTWQKLEAEEKLQAEADKEKKREELAKKRAEMEKARQALIEEGRLDTTEDEKKEEDTDEPPKEDDVDPPQD
ncbi:tetratricopeptide repeat protein [Kordiimonas sp.]|uniref:tetratricopeptide repeat protein n=1 Tax=Kordiimonas sp. TaxID=1970157 RepID=UPI003A9399BB